MKRKYQIKLKVVSVVISLHNEFPILKTCEWILRKVKWDRFNEGLLLYKLNNYKQLKLNYNSELLLKNILLVKWKRFFIKINALLFSYVNFCLINCGNIHKKNNYLKIWIIN